jgi:hypothetical protein
MVARRMISFAAFSGLALAGCGPGSDSSSTESPGSGSSSTESLCPRCSPLPEPPENDPSISGCIDQPKLLPEGLSTTLQLDDVRKRAETEFQASLRWEPDDTWGPVTAMPSGYSELTSIRGKVSLGEPFLLERVPVRDSADPQDCGSVVQFPASITFSTSDGALLVETDARLRLEQEPLEWDLYATIDLAKVRGSLDLKIDSGRIHKGSFTIDLHLLPTGFRGRLHPFLIYFANADEAARYDPRSDVLEGTIYAPISARFPVDDCEVEALPIQSGTPQEWLGGRSFSESFEAARAAASTGTLSGRWRNGTPTDVSVDIGDLPGGAVCMGPTGTSVFFKFPTAGKVESSDGRVAARLLSGTLVTDSPTDRPSVLWFYSELHDVRLNELLNPPEGAAPAGGSVPTVRVEADFQWNQGVLESTGLVESWGEQFLNDCMIWPVKGPYDILCPL